MYLVERRKEMRTKDLNSELWPLQRKVLPKYHSVRAHSSFSSVSQGVRLTWFTMALSLLVSLKASWCSEDAVLPAWRGEVLPASW